MRSNLTLALTLIGLVAGLVPTPVQAQGFFPGRQVGARVWVENDREYFRRGDRLDVRFSVSDDAYVAVVHIDSDGYLDFVFPASPWDNEYVRGGRVHSVPMRGGSSWTVRGRPGIGYLYILASASPLDFSYFRGRTGSPWDWGYAGRSVHGDPFLAMHQISRMLVPWSSSGFVEDYYGYYVDGIHRYPSYACSDRYYDSGWGWSPSYGSCGRMDYFLRDYPDYYDTRRYRGDRRSYFGDYDRLDPLHGFKEDPDRGPARGVTPRSVGRPATGRGTTTAPPTGAGQGVDRRAPVPEERAAPAQGRAVPERSRAPEPRAAPTPRAVPDRRPTPAAPAREPQASDRRDDPSGGAAPASDAGRRPARGRP